MIEEYWNEVFGAFKVGEREFQIPGFPEALMSPHFGVKNIIGPAKEPKNSFTLCLFDPDPSLKKEDVECESLKDALVSKKFWQHQELYHAESLPFMKKLLPFLVERNKKHFHFFVPNGTGFESSLIAGTTDKIAFLFNLSVAKDLRKKGAARKAFEGARAYFPNQRAFYWTKFPWLSLGAKQVLEYHLL